jgi:hypothetical protein
MVSATKDERSDLRIELDLSTFDGRLGLAGMGQKFQFAVTVVTAFATVHDAGRSR